MTADPSWRDILIANNTPERQVVLKLAIMQLETPSYADFVDLIYKALRLALVEMSHHKNHLHALGEDPLSIFLLQKLTAFTFIARHGTNNGGHTDLLIEGPNGYRWIGEAKLYTSYAKLFGGARQLIDRYSSGLPNEDCGAVIVYVTKPNAVGIMTKWRDYLVRFVDKITAPAPDPKLPLEFETSLFHAGAGRVLTIRHLAAVLYHAPTDPLAGPKKGLKARLGLTT